MDRHHDYAQHKQQLATMTHTELHAYRRILEGQRRGPFIGDTAKRDLHYQIVNELLAEAPAH